MIYAPGQRMIAAEADEIRAWLMLPASRKFMEHLANQSAALAAAAGNALVEDRNDADELAGQARILGAALKLIESMRAPGYEFVTVKLEPQPVIAPTTYGNHPEHRTESFPGSSVAPASPNAS